MKPCQRGINIVYPSTSSRSRSGSTVVSYFGSWGSSFSWHVEDVSGLAFSSS